MLPTQWTPEAARAGVKQEEIEQANERAAQAVQANYQHAAAEAQALRRTAQQLLDVPNLSGQARAALQNALAWPIDPPNVGEAARQLTAAVEWANSDYSSMRLAPPPPPPPPRQAVAPAHPKELTDKERLDRIEKHLGLV